MKIIKIIFYNNNNIDVGLQDKILSNEINVDIIIPNNIWGMLSNDINYQKQYYLQWNINNGKTININEYNNVNHNVNKLEQNMMKGSRIPKF